MEAQSPRETGLQGLQELTLSSQRLNRVDVVRALHQTIVTLRTALDSSREEVRNLKESFGEFSSENYAELVERLALENHLLRRRILSERNNTTSKQVPLGDLKRKSKKSVTMEPQEEKTEPSSENNAEEATKPSENPVHDEAECDKVEESKTEEVEETESSKNLLTVPDKDAEELSSKSASENDSDNGAEKQQQPTQESQDSEKANNESENESEELDDIELIFTTDETCRDVGLQEDLVSIAENEGWQQPTGQPVLLKYTKSLDNDALINGEKANSVDEAASSQSSSIDREESVDRFDESSNPRLSKMWSQCSVLVETDISKCGVLEETDVPRNIARRNTLAAPPTAYRPIIHREALVAGRRKGSMPLRPVMDRSSGARRESGAQTDISALPAQWRSESYLAHKVAHTFTTLPSKFALPAAVSGRLRLSDKTREARRVMLSDISFTSMVPELSRSADHLCQDPTQSCFGSRGGCNLRTPESHRRESMISPAGFWSRYNPCSGLPSPCDCSRLSTDFYPMSRGCRGSYTSIPSPGLEVNTGLPRRHSWRASAASYDTWRVPLAASTPRPTWSSMPSSPTNCLPPFTTTKSTKQTTKRIRSRVTFQECPLIRGSLPNLRTELIGETSGDSTESLIDEAEDYLRRSIDSMLNISSSECWSKQSIRRRRTRRHSEPDLFREWHPPQDARPYLPKIPRDLKVDHLVKVISPEGRVLQGRVRYVGPVPAKEDIHVGVELFGDSGTSDGTFHGRRFFDCETDRAIFVPFKKVVLAWCTN